MKKSDIQALTQQESNNSGSGMFYYEHLMGRPKECTLYKHFRIDGSAYISESEVKLSTEVDVVKVMGMKETCPKNGDGCTVYSCRITGN